MKQQRLNPSWKAGFLFALPALLFTLLFEYYPIGNGIYHAFYRWNGADIEKFVGLDNFAEIIRDDVFWISVKNMFIFLAASIVLMLPTFVACIVLFRLKSARLQYMYRVVFCVQMIIPGMVVLLIWKFMYNPQFGFFNKALDYLGLHQYQQLWLGDSSLALWCLIFMGFPWISTIGALIYMGGLQSIDSSIWDASQIDGVGPIRKAFSLELPLLKGQIKLNLVTVIVGSITGYGTQLIMTNGGPGFSTTTPGLYMYQKAFGTSAEYGYASAVGLILFVIALLISLGAMKFIRSEEA